MRRVLLDTNVLLDVLLRREPHFEPSLRLWIALETGAGAGFASAHAVTTVYYFAARNAGRAVADRMLDDVLRVFSIAAVDEGVIRTAAAMKWPDFEDAVTTCAASHAACELIVTRDPQGFRKSPVRAVTPEAALPLLRPGR